ncbi:hypothetical protein GJ496_011800 [Pomphorhynchus laevis]|nr:hypothetical protein GJ496_011800 [Pomphorhynchus laevis]
METVQEDTNVHRIRTHREFKSYNSTDHHHGDNASPALGKRYKYCGHMKHFTNACLKRRKERMVNNMSCENGSTDNGVINIETRKLLINKTIVDMIIDSGANVNIIDRSTFDRIKTEQPTIELTPTNKIPKAHGNSDIPIIGEFLAIIANKFNKSPQIILVTKEDKSRNILTKGACIDLQLLDISE